jgi:hypothetical protein
MSEFKNLNFLGACKPGLQLQGEKSCNFYEKPRSRPYLTFLAKILPSGLAAPLIRVWGTRFSEQNFYFTPIYVLNGDQKSEGNLHNVTF